MRRGREPGRQSAADVGPREVRERIARVPRGVGDAHRVQVEEAEGVPVGHDLAGAERAVRENRPRPPFGEASTISPASRRPVAGSRARWLAAGVSPRGRLVLRGPSRPVSRACGGCSASSSPSTRGAVPAAPGSDSSRSTAERARPVPPAGRRREVTPHGHHLGHRGGPVPLPRRSRRASRPPPRSLPPHRPAAWRAASSRPRSPGRRPRRPASPGGRRPG